MNFEVLKRSHLKRNIIIGVVAVAIISAVILNFTRAKYVYTDKMPLINGTVNYNLADLNIVAIYVGGEEVDSLDSSKQYILDTEQSTCTYKDGSTIEGLSISYETETGSLSISPFTTKGTKCTLYFDEVTGQTIQDILANYTTRLTRSDFSTTVTETTTGTIYYANDRDGITYYFAGNPTDNWVRFAGFYWIIIRINGDESIRIIYSGSEATGPATTGDGTQIGTSEFNSSYSDLNPNNMYLGYMYTQNQAHGLGTSSTIKEALDNWYLENIQSTGYSNYIDSDAGFCNDRTPYSGYGTGLTETVYGAYDRLIYNTSGADNAPTFGCNDSRDLFTLKSSSKGNGALTYAIGLITADEVAYAGGLYITDNQNYYLYTGNLYWAMSPSHFRADGRIGQVFYVEVDGGIDVTRPSGNAAVRPVINLKADTQFEVGGDGTSTNPYVVV